MDPWDSGKGKKWESGKPRAERARERRGGKGRDFKIGEIGISKPGSKKSGSNGSLKIQTILFLGFRAQVL